MGQAQEFPLGASLTLEELEADPHPALARLRAREPASWVPSLGGWLITRHDLAVAVMSDPRTFTVEDPRFSTGQVIGPSMLSLDGEAHGRHRAPFTAPFRAPAVATRLAETVQRRAEELTAAARPAGRMEVRRQFAGPLAAGVMAAVLGLGRAEVDDLLRWYDEIVASVTAITAGLGPTAEGGEAYRALRARLDAVMDGPDGPSLLAVAAGDGRLGHDEIAANAAVLLFGGIETTEGMIANALLELLSRPVHLARARHDPATLDGVIDESLRLEPAAAIVDRYATVNCALGPAMVGAGELVRVSITGANRDPNVFVTPDEFHPERPNLRRHLAFAQGPHVCLGVHLARLETRVALSTLLARLPGLRLDPAGRTEARGLVFRKPPRLDVLWDD